MVFKNTSRIAIRVMRHLQSATVNVSRLPNILDASRIDEWKQNTIKYLKKVKMTLGIVHSHTDEKNVFFLKSSFENI